MRRDTGDGDQETITFESVGIGPAGAGPVEFVPVAVDTAAAAPTSNRRLRGAAVGLGLVVLFTAIVWVTNRVSTPDSHDGWQQRLPTDASEAFTWNVPDIDQQELFVAGTSTQPYVMTVGPTSGTIYSLDESGDERWHADIGSASYADAYPSGNLIVAVTQSIEPYADGTGAGGKVVATGFDADTGRQAWQTSVPGDYWNKVDDHIVIVDYPEVAVEETLAGGAEPGDAVMTTASSVDMTSGGRRTTQQYHYVQMYGTDIEPLVTRGDKLFTIDGALNPSSAAVPVGDGAAAAADGTILTIGEDTITAYDDDGAVIRSATDLPDGFEDTKFWTLSGAGGDLWLYSTDATDSECGAFRFADGDASLVELWRHEDCYYVYFSHTFGDAGADTGQDRYALSWSSNSPTDPGQTGLVHITTGSTITESTSIEVGSNGFVVSDDKQIVGQKLSSDGSPEPLFTLPVTSDDWQLLDGAVAIIQRRKEGTVESVTVYR